MYNGIISSKIIKDGEETLKQYNLPNHKEDSNYQYWNESYKLYEELKNKEEL